MTDVLRHPAGDPAAITWSPPALEELMTPPSSGVPLLGQPSRDVRVLQAAHTALENGETAADRITAASGLLAAAEGAGFLPRLQKAVDGILSMWSLEDYLALNQACMTTVVEQYDVFLLNALETYSDYVLDELARLAEFVTDIADTLNTGRDLLGCGGEYVLASVASAMFAEDLVGTTPSSLYDYCPQAREIVRTWDSINGFISEARATLDRLRSGDAAGRALDFLAEIALAGADLFAQPKTKAYIYAFYQDAARLGQLVGTIAGFLMWQVIETVATAGIGKIKHTTKIGAALKFAAEMAI